MTAYELIRELAKCEPDAEIEGELKIDGITHSYEIKSVTASGQTLTGTGYISFEPFKFKKVKLGNPWAD
jgi:hypothetical protein